MATPPSPPVIPPLIVQQAPAPLSAAKVTDLFTGLVAGLTGIPLTLVRPRWQPTPPQQPPAGTDWASVGITQRLASGYSHQSIQPLPGTTTEALYLRRWESLEALASFYGPNAEDNAELFRDSLYIGVNLAGLKSVGIRLTGLDEVLAVPDLTNYQWIDHQDIRIQLAREIDRYFPLKSVLTSVGTLEDDEGYLVELSSAQHTVT